ncbi:hypothetical protein MTR67_019315, partial [Solanum verrucosum]
SPRTLPENWLRVKPRQDLRTIGQTMVRGPEKLERKRRNEVKNPSSRTQQDSISSNPEIEGFLRGIRHQVQILNIQITLRLAPDLQLNITSGVMRFGKKGKLNPRYVCPYQILKRIASIVSLEIVAVKNSFSYEDVPIEILDHQICKLNTTLEIGASLALGESRFTGATLVMLADYIQRKLKNFLTMPKLGG